MTNKHELKMKQLQKYKIMDTATKQNLQDKKADQHKTMDTAKKQKLLEKCREEHSYCCSKKTLDSCVEQYKKKIRESPCYICFVCNTSLYKTQACVACKSYFFGWVG